MDLPYKIPIKELIERYEHMYTAAINDVFQQRNMHHQWLGPQIECRTKSLELKSVAGIAFTVQWVHNPEADRRDMPAARMVDSYPEHGMIVVDTGADQISGFWGELATTVCIRNGVRGAVINGGSKDTGFVKRMGFPIFCKFTSPVDGFYRSQLWGWQIPIWINEIRIDPGDVIVGDSDGVLVVPQAIAEEVLIETECLVNNESETRMLLKAGVPPDEASRRTGRKDL